MEKIRRDLQWTGPTGRTLQHIVIERAHAEELVRHFSILQIALGRLINDSMYKDHPEASQMAIDARRETE